MGTSLGNYNVNFRGAGLLGPGPSSKSWGTPYTQDDYGADMQRMMRPGGSGYSARGNGSPAAIASAFSAGGFGQNSPGQQATMRTAGFGDGSMYGYGSQPSAPGAAGQPQQPQVGGSNPFQYNTGISPYQSAMSPLQSLYNAKASSYPGQTQAGAQEGGRQQHQLLSGLAGGMMLDTEGQARQIDATHGLARDQARANAGLGYGGLGLSMYGNQMQAQAPWDAFAAHQATLPINAIGGLLRGLVQ